MNHLKPESMSDNLYNYIKSKLEKEDYIPSLTLNAIMDAVFDGSEKWWEFEYETILQSLSSIGISLRSVHLLGEIQCISAIRGGNSFIDKEWHLLEKAALALTGIPVLFFEKQNIPIEIVYHATKLIRRMGKYEPSEEVKHYIGCEAINDEILWYPIKDIDTEIVSSMGRLKSIIGMSDEDLAKVRDATETKFNSIMEEDLETVEFDNSKVEDVMCASVLKSILIGKNLEEIEHEALSKFTAIKDGVEIYTPDTDKPAIPVQENETDITDEFDPEIELVEESSEEIVTIGDTIKEAQEALFKEASRLPGVPIDTGVVMSGQEDDSKGPSQQSESTPPLEGDAEAMIEQAKINATTGDTSESSSHEVVDPSIAFEL